MPREAILDLKILLGIFRTLRHYIGMKHISDDDLERYDLGLLVDEGELTPIEEHLLACPQCVERAEQAAAYVDTLRAAIIAGNFDLELNSAPFSP
jgi:hypothetical protein